MLLSLLIPMTAQAASNVAAAATRAPLPTDRLHFGLANGPGTEFDWMVNSGVPWHYRYQYLAGGVNNGSGSTDPCGPNGGWQTWNSPAGQFVTDYITASVAHSVIPVFTYYEIVQSNPSPGNEGAELTKISTVCTMQAYWADFTVLMQKVGASGAQVVVHVEPDFWGFMEHQSADPTTLTAVVASSGNADLAGLPNTVAGMGLAFLKLRDKYAPNALLAIHASSWASGVDIASDQRTTVDPAAEADKVIAFINKAGLVGNPSGITPWDVIFNDVADHDAAWYGAASNPHWWDRNNVVFPNFTRWLAFMSRMHTDTTLPLVEWQVPVGNQYYETMNNTDGHYQDNRSEYFLAHPDQLSAAGIVAVLFGKANAGQTNYWDEKADGITNPAPVSSWQCNLCNNHASVWPDDDGGFLRVTVGAYYGALPCATASLTANPPSPSGAAQVTWTAGATGCPSPRYRFWELDPGSRWSMVRDYSPTNTFLWNAPAPGGDYKFEVDVRDATEQTAYDVVKNVIYTRPTTGCASAGLSASPTSPGATGAAVTFTGTSTGCASPTYRFWIRDPGRAWSMVQDYSAATTHSWPQTGLAGSYSLEVDVRDASETTVYDVVANGTYVVNGCSAAGLTANPPSGGAHGTLITLTATSTCPGTATYKFWIKAPGGSWTVVQPYGTGNTFSWTPAIAGTYSLEVDVRDQGGTDTYEKVANLTYAVK